MEIILSILHVEISEKKLIILQSHLVLKINKTL